MKNINFLYIITFVFFLSCSKNDEDRLNDDTFTGYAGILCEINGQVLKPSSSIIHNDVTCKFDTTLDNIPFLTIGFYNNGSGKPEGFKSIRIVAMNAVYANNNNLTGEIFYLGEKITNESFGVYINGDFNNPYQTTEIVNGELEIIFHDPEERIVAGKFWFDAVNKNNEIVEIRNGVFDMTNQ